MNIKFTIFTPTYNRENYLLRCYKSIVSQSVSSLEWIVIDDGSTDNTKNLISQLIEEKKIKIRYIYQENAGKQAAWNRAINESNGTYFICLDSDDALVNNSLSLIEKKLYLLETNDTIIGFRCLAISQKKQKPDSSFTPQKSDACSWFDEFSSRIFGERIDVLKTCIIKDFLYPVKDNIKFIPEIWFYVMTAKCGYTFIYLNEPVRIFYDNHEHLRLSKSNLKKNAHGHYIARKAMLKYIPASVFFKNPIALIKTSIRYFQSIYFMYNRK